jgi:glycosyltransferase involved in cell wall biosynthesis
VGWDCRKDYPELPICLEYEMNKLVKKQSSYIIIMPVRDEADYLERTLKCLIQQTLRPTECIIVDDGSTDATPQIIRTYTSQFSWIKGIHRSDRGVRQRGAGVVQAFYDGLDQIECSDWEYAVKMDADLAFHPFYFEEILDRFTENPKLGLASGSLYIYKGSRWVLDKAPKDRTWGAIKMYRRGCFEEIGGIVPQMGWDAIDDFKAQMFGWQTRSFENIVVLHYRPVGARSRGFQAGIEHGRCNYNVGSHPLFILIRGFYRMFIDRPFIVAGAGIIYGYFSDWVSRKPRMIDAELVKFVQKKDLARLTFGIIH